MSPQPNPIVQSNQPGVIVGDWEDTALPTPPQRPFAGVDNSWVPLDNYASTLALNDSWIYFGLTGPDRIGRVAFDGTGLNENLLDVFGTLGDDVQFLDLVLSAAKMYWSDDAGHIAWANLDGSAPAHLFTLAAGRLPLNVAVDGAHLYYAHVDDSVFPFIDGRIGRANLDGTGRNDNWLVIGDTFFGGLAVDSAHLYVGSASSIGRANIDGTGLNMAFIPVAVTTPQPDAGVVNITFDNAGHIYWCWQATPNMWGGPIGRANLDGTAVDVALTPATTPAQGLAIRGDYIYWTSEDNPSIGRARTNGAAGQRYVIPNSTEIATSGPPVGVGVGTAGRSRTLPPLKATTFTNTGSQSGGNIPIPRDAPALASYGFTQPQAQAILAFLQAVSFDLINLHSVLGQLVADLINED